MGISNNILTHDILVEGLNLKFSLFQTSCPTNTKEPNLPSYLPIAEREKKMDLCLSQGH